METTKVPLVDNHAQKFSALAVRLLELSPEGLTQESIHELQQVDPTIARLMERTPYLTRVVMEELGAGDDAPLYNPQLDPDAELALFEGDLASVQEERQHLQRELVEHLKNAVNIAGILGRSLEAHHVQGGAFWDNLAGNLEGYRRAAEVEPAR